MFTFKLLLHAAVLLGLMQILDVSGKTFIEDLTLTASEKKTLDKVLSIEDKCLLEIGCLFSET